MSAVDLAGSRVGRFELQRVLGKGAQATVWLAHDERLEREVAVKLLNPGADELSVHQWLHEARAVSRLAHPNIVPLFEADEADGRSYLVFEFVDGRTLAQALRSRGALPAHEAVAAMLGVLDALAAAHAQGIVHRDLKPTNVLVGNDGRARVMDFGIAARVATGRDGRIVGTPGYMSPEAARGDAPTPTMDVFSAGMVLAEMLGGAPLLRERDPWIAVRRVQDEDMMLAPAAQVDEGLRAIVQRALSRSCVNRFADAATMQRALSDWNKPATPDAPPGRGTLDFLLRRMRHKTDFPALSSAVLRIQRVANSDRESLGSLANEILKDVALTNKLLRMVNSAHFSHAADGGVSTVSRAVALVGFAGIRNMALSVVLLEHMEDKAHAQILKVEFLRSLLAGHLAGELCAAAPAAEEAFLGAMFQNLGRLVTEFYLPEEANQIRALVRPVGATGTLLGPPVDESTASARVLGLSFAELGLGVARAWGLPDSLCSVMHKPQGAPPSRAIGRGPERVRWIAAAANEVADVLLASDPADAARRVAQVADRHARALGLTHDSLQKAATAARDKVAQVVQALAIELAPSSPARRLLGQAHADAAPDADSLTGLELHATRATQTAAQAMDEPTRVVARRPREEISQMLTTGIQDITNSMVADSFKLNEVLRMVLETMFRALHFQRVIFCLRDPRTGTLTGRFGLGDRASELAPHFRVPLNPDPGMKPDLFSAVCLKGADTLITDASAATIAARIPDWHRKSIGAPAFLLLPLAMKGAPFALIYADKATPGEIELDEKELNLLRTLRNQAVMAFRQAG
jgi:eukaryotic-like serine/threonine-protein kinase